MDKKLRKECDERGELVPVSLIREDPGLAKRVSRLPVIRTVVAGILAVPTVLRFAVLAVILSSVTVLAVGQWQDVFSIGGGASAPPPVATSGWSPGYGQGSATECTTTISTGSIETAANGLAAGQVLCVRGGIYTEGDQRLNLTTSGASGSPKKIKAYPGERVEIRGSLRAGTAQHWVLEGLFVDASYSPIGTGTHGRINTDQTINYESSQNVVLDYVELVNRDSGGNPDKMGTCVFGGSTSANNNALKNSYIHECGQTDEIYEHCAYLNNAANITLTDNYFYDCANRALQIYPGVNGATISGNVVHYSRQGYAASVINDATSNVTASNNVFLRGGSGASFHIGNAYTGTNNHLQDNCFSPTGLTHQTGGTNVTQTGSLVVSPEVAVSNTVSGTIRTVKVEHAGCADKLPVGSRFRP